jgi:xylulokinase
MVRKAATLGIDVGTSALKGILLDTDGRVLASASADYPLLTPHPGWSEQDPNAWWTACGRVCRALLAKVEVDVIGVGLSGQMHGSTFLDAHGEVIRPALLWNDARTGAECAEIERRVGRRELIRITGNRANAGFQAPKILWLQANEPEAYGRIVQVLLPKDFIRFRLTGERATDAADASGTMLLDIATRRYSRAMQDALEIPDGWLPEVFESADVTGRVSAAGAAATGLPAGIPVVAGGADNACAAVGAGIIAEGQGVCSLGTSGTVFVHASRPLVDPEGAINAFCACTPDGWHGMGVILSAGGALRWFVDTLEPKAGDGRDPFESLMAEVDRIEPGAGGVMFLPYLAGERSPHADPDARAAWTGLSLAHDRRHMARAVVEGIGFAFADCVERMRALGAAPPSLLLVGGGARSPAWQQILAAQLDLALEPRAAQEGPALGAAILALVGSGASPDLATAVRLAVPLGDPRAVRHPDPALARTYAALHRRWQRLYPALRDARGG